jgi:hypothetical protein
MIGNRLLFALFLSTTLLSSMQLKSMQFFEKCLCCFVKPTPPAKKLTKQPSKVSTVSTLSPKSASAASTASESKEEAEYKPPKYSPPNSRSYDNYNGEIPEIRILFPVPEGNLNKKYLKTLTTYAQKCERASKGQVTFREKYLEESLETAQQILAIAQTKQIKSEDLQTQVNTAETLFYKNARRHFKSLDLFDSAFDQNKLMLKSAIDIAQKCEPKLTN